MKFYKITLYLYLIFGLFFLYDTVTKYQEGGDFKISLAFAVVAIFMFFFRKRHIKKIEDNQKNNQ